MEVFFVSGMAEDAATFTTYPNANQTVTDILVASGVANESFADSIVNSGLFPTPNTANETLDVYNVSVRVVTDMSWKCHLEATVVAAAAHDVFPAVYAYEFGRSYPVWKMKISDISHAQTDSLSIATIFEFSMRSAYN